jgi:hypothetical protein
MWDITVLSMGRSNIVKYTPFAVMGFYLLAGDYLSLFRYIQLIL